MGWCPLWCYRDTLGYIFPLSSDKYDLDHTLICSTEIPWANCSHRKIHKIVEELKYNTAE